MVGTVLHMSTEKQKGVTADSCWLLKAGVISSCFTTYDEFKIRSECRFDICRLETRELLLLPACKSRSYRLTLYYVC